MDRVKSRMQDRFGAKSANWLSGWLAESDAHERKRTHVESTSTSVNEGPQSVGTRGLTY